ncbi:efflux RND transporter permease subunit [Prosthecochloris sp.]|uniref:efflux RND transporter permease subunit n=1 Tax=Prosthecochloris sp. TaxID=290513 RepID=UPI0025800100|nr:efflux RND transporter permease subunit [Prosthecochloris sp.]
MLDRVIAFFIHRHLLTNMVFVVVLAAGLLAWSGLKKEELPDITFDTVRISVNYPGASAEEVEYHVTDPFEEALGSVEGIQRLVSSTAAGSCIITAELEPGNIDAIVTEIRQEVFAVDLPDAIRDDPRIRVFKTSRKAIIDIGLILHGEHLLDTEQRRWLQNRALNLEKRLLAAPEVSRITRSGYLADEIHIKVNPAKLEEYNIPFNTVMNEISRNNVREPAGSIETLQEPKVTLYGELRTPEALQALAVQGGFEGQVLRLGDIAKVAYGHEKNRSVLKINGHEGILLKVAKSSGTGILEALHAVNRVVDDFESLQHDNSALQLVILDDEAIDLRNRLSIIGINGAIGFALILVILFVFLDLRSGFWVAVGIPFSFCFALAGTLFIGYSINNITLAAVIIVMGIVVDDALVVAENIKRTASSGAPLYQAATDGTSMVFMPVIASILTTCLAFVPLLFFEGRFGAMVAFIPAVVTLMLTGSMLEALFILPGHLTLSAGKSASSKREHRFETWESFYAGILGNLLPFRWLILTLFLLGFIATLLLAGSFLAFSMFPDEETREVRLTGESPPESTQYETANSTQPLENRIAKSIGKEVVGFRNEIAKSRRGSVVEDNVFRMRIEIAPKESREKTADQLIEEWQESAASSTTLSKLRFSKTRHGQESGSPVEVVIKEDDESTRRNAANALADAMKNVPGLTNIEQDQPKSSPEYRITLKRDKIKRLDIDPSQAAQTLRAALEGTILYEFSSDNEPVGVRFSLAEPSKQSLESLLEVPVENKAKYLVPLHSIIMVEKVEKPNSIVRRDRVRYTSIYADIDSKSGKSPLEIAETLEQDVFPAITSRYPSTTLEFDGEILDSRKSKKDFIISIFSVLALIFIVLVLLFNSLRKALLIMLTIPFGLTGIIVAFIFHGIEFYGFFAVIGALGLAGVIVNDAIIMVTRLDRETRKKDNGKNLEVLISKAASTRLRAVLLTTLTTVAAMLPTAYGWAGYDPTLSQMMLALTWGLIGGTFVTLILVPCLYRIMIRQTQCPEKAQRYPCNN